MPRAVVAIGGHALVPHTHQSSMEDQFAQARLICEHLAELVIQGWDLVLTHGNGPQVGALLRSFEADPDAPPMPLDVIDADTQGGIGYMLQQLLGNALRGRGSTRTVVALVTQVVVETGPPGDTQGVGPVTKPVGRFLTEDEARRARDDFGWTVAPVPSAEPGAEIMWRRMVASPKPVRIVERAAIAACIDHDLIPITVGGGGVPVVEDIPGRYRGVPAVVDKDRASALLANELGADLLLITTDVPAVQVGFGGPQPRALGHVLAAELADHARAGEFPPGSMGPKVEAILEFVTRGHGGRRGIITDPPNILAAVAGQTGTIVT